MMRRHVLRGLTILALATAACRSGPQATTPPPEAAAISVQVTEVKQEKIGGRIEVTGTLAAWEEATVSVEAEGRIVAIRFDLGDRVKRGTVLAQIAPQEYELRQLQSEADLAASEADFKRVDDLARQQMATPAQLDESRRRVAIARAAAELARKKLSDTRLLAPIDGVVSRRLVNVGEYVRGGAAAFQIVRNKPLKLKADVPERYASDVRVGDAVEVMSEALPGDPLKGRVARVSPVVAVESRSFAIEAEIDNPEGTVKPGTFARAHIATAAQLDWLVVPVEAVASFAGTPRVFVLQGGKAAERIVEVAGRDNGRALIASGIGSGDQVITSGVASLTDGIAVTIRP